MNPGSMRMSPLMYGSLRYIATRHSGTLDINEVSELKQTQLRSFKTHEWIAENADRRGITITKEGRVALRAFEDNDDFFRKVATMSFTSLLNLTLPGEDRPPRVARQAPKSVHPLKHQAKKTA